MNFIAILVMFALLKYWGSFRFFQHDEWFEFLQDAGSKLSDRHWPVYIVSVILPVFVLFLALLLFHDKLFGLLSLVISIATLIYSLGRVDYNAIFAEYVQAWGDGKFEQLPAVLEKFGNVPVDFGDGLEKTHVTARDCYIYSAFQGVFVVLFWFVLLGPVAVFFYRLNSLYVGKCDAGFSRMVQLVMEWPAACLASLTFILMGSFDRGLPVFLGTVFNRGMSVRHIVHANGLASLGLNMDWLTGDFQEHYQIDSETALALNEARLLTTMVRRSIFFIVFVVAIFQIVI